MMIVLNVPSGVINALLFVIADIMLVELAMGATSFLESLLIWRKVNRGGSVKIKELPLPIVGDNLLGVNVGSYVLILIRVAIIVSLFVSTIGINGRTAPVVMTERRDVKVGTGRYNGEKATVGLIDSRLRKEENFVFAQCIRQKGTERVYYRFGANIAKNLQKEFTDAKMEAGGDFKPRKINATSLTCLDGIMSIKEEVDARLEAYSETVVTRARKETIIPRNNLPVTYWTLYNPFAALVTLELPTNFLSKYLRFNSKHGSAGSGELICLISNKDLTNFFDFNPSSVLDTSMYQVQCLSAFLMKKKVHLMTVGVECNDQECKISTTREVNALEFKGRFELSVEDMRNVSRDMVRSWEGRIVTPLELYDSWWTYSLNIIGPEMNYKAKRDGATVNQTTVEFYSFIILLFWSAFGLLSTVYRLFHSRAHQVMNTVNGLSRMLEQKANPGGEYGPENLHAKIGIIACEGEMRIGPLRGCEGDVLRAKVEAEGSSSSGTLLETYFSAA